jgi:hypothetical protein
MRIHVGFLLVVCILVSLTQVGCVPGDGKHTEEKPAGFFWGIWHGWIAPISLIWSIFDRSIRVYEKVNTGWWYDFGYYMAVISGFGGLSLARRSGKSKSD